MNQENMVRVHLKQAILIGYGKEARYSKVLLGERQQVEVHDTVQFQSFVIIGFVHGYQGYNLAQPTRIAVADKNILAIEDAKIEPGGGRMRPPAPHVAVHPWCSLEHPHPPHTWFYGRGPDIHCPGQPDRK